MGDKFQEDIQRDPEPPELDELVELIEPAREISVSNLFKAQQKGLELMQEFVRF